MRDRFCAEQLEVSSVNKYCTQITTRWSDRNLVRLIVQQDNTTGPMGSGGYSIRLASRPDEMVRIEFRQMDCAPAPTHHAFIKDGVIWATHMKEWVLEQLLGNGIGFSCERVPNPSFIEEKMSELNAA